MMSKSYTLTTPRSIKISLTPCSRSYGLESKKRIRAFKNDVIKITPFFGSTLLDTEHWGMLDDEQVLHLDYSKIKQDQFDAMFPRYGLEPKKRIRSFKNDVSKVTKFFSREHWEMLDDDQKETMS